MKAVKWVAAVALLGIAIYTIQVWSHLSRLPSVDGLADRGMNRTIQVRDWQGKLHPFQVGPRNQWWTPVEKLSPTTRWAFVLAEDVNFYHHEGVDLQAMKDAIKYDLEKRQFARGASTITQQAAKNLFLSREKTLTRKIEEILLARRMEQELSKERILELYVNIVELGPMVYGIGHGARYYFDRPASRLTPREAAFLAAMLPGPRKAYNPYRHMDRVLARSDMILQQMRRKGVLSEAEYRMASAEVPDIGGMQRKLDQSLSGKVRQLLKGFFGL